MFNIINHRDMRSRHIDPKLMGTVRPPPTVQQPSSAAKPPEISDDHPSLPDLTSRR